MVRWMLRLGVMWVVVAAVAAGGWVLSGEAGAGGSVLDLPLSLVTPTPGRASPDEVAAAYFRAWEANRYNEMYSLVHSKSRNAIAEEQFAAAMRTLRPRRPLMGSALQQASPGPCRLRPTRAGRTINRCPLP